jgi:hypothetical protein
MREIPMKVVADRAVDTPTLVDLKARRAQTKEYRFSLTSRDLKLVGELGDAALIAYAVIRGAAWGPRAKEWVTVSQRATDHLDRGYRWWHAATRRLEEAGVSQVERHRGRLPRYRLVQRRKGGHVIGRLGNANTSGVPVLFAEETNI